MKTKPTVWKFYGSIGDHGIMEFADKFNRSYEKGEISPPSSKVAFLKSANILIAGFLTNILALVAALWWSYKMSYHWHVSTGLENSKADFLLVWISVSLVLFLFCFPLGKFLDDWEYLRRFEKLGGEFGTMILLHSPSNLSLMERCQLVLNDWAKTDLMNQHKGKAAELRAKVNHIIDLMVETSIILPTDVHKVYSLAYETAKKEIAAKEPAATI